MKIVVLLKKTPDTETKIRLNSDQSAVDHADTKFIINPYDEFAIEEALRVKEKAGSGEVVICSFGDAGVRELIVKGLAMGADRGLLIANDGLEHADSLTTAKILAAALKTENPDLVLCGKQAIDDDNMHVGVMVAELMNIPHINVVTKVEMGDGSAVVEREVEGGQVEVFDVKLPCVMGAHKSLNQPRYASLPGIMKAKRKPLDQKKPEDFGLNSGELQSQIRVQTVSFEFPPEKPAGQIFKGEPTADMVEKVVKLLREQAKVI